MENKGVQPVSLKLSPTDIKNKEFKKAMMGYAPREVVEFLDEVAKTWEKVQRNEKELIKKIESLSEEIDKWKAREPELQQIREKALKEAEEIRNQASKEAARVMQNVEERASGVRRVTEEWLASVIGHLEETQRQKVNFLSALKSSLDNHYEMIRTEEKEEPLASQFSEYLKKQTSLSL